MIFGAAGPSPQLVGVRVCLSYPVAWHFHKIFNAIDVNDNSQISLVNLNQSVSTRDLTDMASVLSFDVLDGPTELSADDLDRDKRGGGERPTVLSRATGVMNHASCHNLTQTAMNQRSSALNRTKRSC